MKSSEGRRIEQKTTVGDKEQERVRKQRVEEKSTAQSKVENRKLLWRKRRGKVRDIIW